MSQQIRVAVANQPRFMRELLLETISEHPDIEIVAEIQEESEIPQVVEGTHPDFLIIALTESDQCPPMCSVLLGRYPEMKILALAPERNSGVIFSASVAIQRFPLEVSEAGILSTLLRKQ